MTVPTEMHCGESGSKRLAREISQREWLRNLTASGRRESAEDSRELLSDRESVREFTERERTERELRQSKERELIGDRDRE